MKPGGVGKLVGVDGAPKQEPLPKAMPGPDAPTGGQPDSPMCPHTLPVRQTTANAACLGTAAAGGDATGPRSGTLVTAKYPHLGLDGARTGELSLISTTERLSGGYA